MHWSGQSGMSQDERVRCCRGQDEKWWYEFQLQQYELRGKTDPGDVTQKETIRFVLDK